MALDLEVHDRPSAALLDEIEQALVRHNESAAPPEGYQPVAVEWRVDGRLLAGAGFTHWNWLFIEHLWVDGDHRGTGVGADVLAALESRAVERGARHARVCSYGFQSPGFHLRRGYEEFAVLQDYPPGSSLHFLHKGDRALGHPGRALMRARRRAGRGSPTIPRSSGWEEL